MGLALCFGNVGSVYFALRLVVGSLLHINSAK
jgi:hypothetical protein